MFVKRKREKSKNKCFVKNSHREMLTRNEKKTLWIKVITITIIILSVGPEQRAEYKLELKIKKEVEDNVIIQSVI